MDKAMLKLVGAALAVLVAAGGASAQGPNVDWTSYTGDITGSRYKPLNQINASNFGRLEVAWRFKTDNIGTRPEYKLEGTPLAINGVLYTTAGTRRAGMVRLPPRNRVSAASMTATSVKPQTAIVSGIR